MSKVDEPFAVRLGVDDDALWYQNVTAEVGTYAESGRVAIRLVCNGEPLCTVTVNLPDFDPVPGAVFVKNWSENEGLLAELVRLGWGTPTGRIVPSGYVEVPEFELSGEWLKVLEAIEGVKG